MANINQLRTPILFIIFNRIETTREVFDSIKQQRPLKLFIAADGPRPGKPGEKEKCENIRKRVLANIDWDCEVKTLFREENVGCGRGPSEAITWFFEHVEEGIILEDDCLPNDSFFKFCAENLERYRNHPEISIVSGNNFQKLQPMEIDADYYFSVFPSTWGWATWKRTWDGFEYYIPELTGKEKTKLIEYLFDEPEYQLWWKNKAEWMHQKMPDDMWDFQFYFHCMKRRQLAVIPKANLVSNIGHGAMATHTTGENSYFANIPAYGLQFPLIHPVIIERNYDADVFVQKMLFGEVEIVSSWKKLKRLVKRVIKYK